MIVTAWNDKRNVTIPPTNADLRDMTEDQGNQKWMLLVQTFSGFHLKYL